MTLVNLGLLVKYAPKAYPRTMQDHTLHVARLKNTTLKFVSFYTTIS